ncbi:MAG: hypothetical protein GC161_02840 [Planctomycetaceae bacterium]|nr:hypothetical protein [Planctomycetaceae bacterium]
MKRFDEAVLERNLSALFARAYRPVAADPAFLARAERQFLDTLAERGAPVVRRRPANPRTGWGAALAAAVALLLLATLGPRTCGGSERSTPTDSVAQGGRAVAPETPAAELPNAGATAGRREAREAGAPAEQSTAAARSETPVEKPTPGPDGSDPAASHHARLQLLVELPPGADPAGFELAVLEQRGWPEVVEPERFRPALDGAGRAERIELAAGSYELFARAPGAGAFGPLEIELGAGAERAVTLVLGPPRALVGRVHDARGDGIADATLLLESATPPRAVDLDPSQWHELSADFAPHTTSGPDGRFELTGLPLGPLVLRVQADGHGPAWVRVDASVHSVDVELGSPAAVTGRVDAPSGGPWVGAVVIAVHLLDPGGTSRAAFRAAAVDHGGRYRLADLASGFHVVLLMAPDAVASEVRAMRYVELATDETAVLDFAEASAAASLSGRLVDADGAPVAGRSLGLWRDGVEGSAAEQTTESLGGNWVAAVTDADGQFAFADLAPGAWTVFSSTALETHIASIAWVTLERSADSFVELTLPTGSVELRADGVPSFDGPGMVVVWRTEADGSERFAGRANAADDGVTRLGPLPPGSYRVELYGEGRRIGQATTSVGTGPAVIELAVESAGPIQNSETRAQDAQRPPNRQP